MDAGSFLVAHEESPMPHKPKHPCSWPGCPELTDERYCQEHARLAIRNYNRNTRTRDQKRRYGNHWKRTRDAFLEEHPFCEICRSEGRIVQADTVHHILPISEGGSNEWDNLQALCHTCHSRLHARRGDRWGRKESSYPRHQIRE